MIRIRSSFTIYACQSWELNMENIIKRHCNWNIIYTKVAQ